MPYVQTSFLNLPVTDLTRSLEFYTSLGFVQNHTFSNADSAMISLPVPTHFDTPHASPIKIMLLTHNFFNKFLPSDRKLSDAKSTAQMLMCFSRESKQAVDEMIKKAEDAGAKVDIRGKNKTEEECEDAGMYGRVFEDSDGHIVELMYMPPETYEGKE